MRRLDRVLVAAALLLVAAVAVDALHGRGGDRGSEQAERAAGPPGTTALRDGGASAPTPTTTRGATGRARWSGRVVAAAPVPEEVRLVPSSTTFLRRCPPDALSLRVGPGPQLVLRFAGPRCHVPPLHLQATIRDASDRVFYRGPALASEELSGNFAGRGVRRARLLIGCRTERLVATVTGSGLTASGPIRCRGSH